jgi:hypothetical protein
MFTTLLSIHIISGFICLMTGLIAGIARKKKGLHTITGEVYHGAYVIVFITAIVMAIMHWQESAFLFFIALFSYAFALRGYLARKLRWKNWMSHHIVGMLGSYIGIVTATLVTNFHKIPLLNSLPELLIWFIPTIIGSPIIGMTTKKYLSKPKPISSSRPM